jgi:hypothetical protein
MEPSLLAGTIHNVLHTFDRILDVRNRLHSLSGTDGSLFGNWESDLSNREHLGRFGVELGYDISLWSTRRLAARGLENSERPFMNRIQGCAESRIRFPLAPASNCPAATLGGIIRACRLKKATGGRLRHPTQPRTHPRVGRPSRHRHPVCPALSLSEPGPRQGHTLDAKNF